MSSDRVRQFVDDDGWDVMELDDVRCSDAGDFTVIGVNQLGSCSSAATLVVQIRETVGPTSLPDMYVTLASWRPCQ